eukprot:gene7652-10414_t
MRTIFRKTDGPSRNSEQLWCHVIQTTLSKTLYYLTNTPNFPLLFVNYIPEQTNRISALGTIMTLNFPAKIYQILENESSDIVRWHHNGLAFRIVDHSRFEAEIIPKYFRHNQLSSVQRQLNLYGFKCISRGEDKGAFFHPKFKRGDWEVVRKIQRFVPIKKPVTDPTRDKDDNESRADSTEFGESSSSNSKEQQDWNWPPTHFKSVHYQDFAMYGHPSNTVKRENNGVSSLEHQQYQYPYNQTPYMQTVNTNNSSNIQSNYMGFQFPPLSAVSSKPPPSFISSQYSSNVPVSQPSQKISSALAINNSSIGSDLTMNVSQSILTTRLGFNTIAPQTSSQPLTVKTASASVTIDPYADFFDDLSFFATETIDLQTSFIGGASTNTLESQSQPTPIVTKKTTCEIGINTDISQDNTPLDFLLLMGASRFV